MVQRKVLKINHKNGVRGKLGDNKVSIDLTKLGPKFDHPSLIMGFSGETDRMIFPLQSSSYGICGSVSLKPNNKLDCCGGHILCLINCAHKHIFPYVDDLK